MRPKRKARSGRAVVLVDRSGGAGATRVQEEVFRTALSVAWTGTAFMKRAGSGGRTAGAQLSGRRGLDAEAPPPPVRIPGPPGGAAS